VNELPTLPAGYYFRFREGWFFGPTVVVQLRRSFSLGPFHWTVKVDEGWSTQEIMEVKTDREVALLVAGSLAKELARRRRPVELGDLSGSGR